MKVMVGFFTTESNANTDAKCEVSNYDIAFGSDVIRKSGIDDVFERNGIEVIPSIYASSGAAGVIRKETFEYIESCFLKTVRDHINEIDGIWLMLHGASEVEEIGSGDHHILWEIRKIVGPYLPIAVVCDPHGNCCKEYVEAINIFRSYRESPHTDAKETKILTAQMLCDLLKDRQNIYSCYRKLPLILGGEQSVSADEPVKSINVFMDEMEKDPRVRSASWHVGYIRHDSEVAGCGVVVVPQNTEDQQYCEEKVDELAKYVWDRRHEFHYTGLTARPEEALKMALEFDGKPVYITDSGDNTTSGAPGTNTYILRQFLEVQDLKKKVLIANINDPKTYDQLKDLEIGTVVDVNLGINRDEMSRPVPFAAKILAKGELRGYMMHDHSSVPGYSVLVHVEGTNIDVNIANYRTTMCERHQFEAGGIDMDAYDITVVKQGYIFPELKGLGKLCVMSLTDGATPQDTANLKFRRIMRPMFPIDNI